MPECVNGEDVPEGGCTVAHQIKNEPVARGVPDCGGSNRAGVSDAGWLDGRWSVDCYKSEGTIHVKKFELRRGGFESSTNSKTWIASAPLCTEPARGFWDQRNEGQFHGEGTLAGTSSDSMRYIFQRLHFDHFITGMTGTKKCGKDDEDVLESSGPFQCEMDNEVSVMTDCRGSFCIDHQIMMESSCVSSCNNACYQTESECIDPIYWDNDKCATDKSSPKPKGEWTKRKWVNNECRVLTHVSVVQNKSECLDGCSYEENGPETVDRDECLSNKHIWISRKFTLDKKIVFPEEIEQDDFKHIGGICERTSKPSDKGCSLNPQCSIKGAKKEHCSELGWCRGPIKGTPTKSAEDLCLEKSSCFVAGVPDRNLTEAECAERVGKCLKCDNAGKCEEQDMPSKVECNESGNIWEDSGVWIKSYYTVFDPNGGSCTNNDLLTEVDCKSRNEVWTPSSDSEFKGLCLYPSEKSTCTQSGTSTFKGATWNPGMRTRKWIGPYVYPGFENEERAIAWCLSNDNCTGVLHERVHECNEKSRKWGCIPSNQSRFIPRCSPGITGTSSQKWLPRRSPVISSKSGHSFANNAQNELYVKDQLHGICAKLCEEDKDCGYYGVTSRESWLLGGFACAHFQSCTDDTGSKKSRINSRNLSGLNSDKKSSTWRDNLSIGLNWISGENEISKLYVQGAPHYYECAEKGALPFDGTSTEHQLQLPKEQDCADACSEIHICVVYTYSTLTKTCSLFYRNGSDDWRIGTTRISEAELAAGFSYCTKAHHPLDMYRKLDYCPTHTMKLQDSGIFRGDLKTGAHFSLSNASHEAKCASECLKSVDCAASLYNSNEPKGSQCRHYQSLSTTALPVASFAGISASGTETVNVYLKLPGDTKCSGSPQTASTTYPNGFLPGEDRPHYYKYLGGHTDCVAEEMEVLGSKLFHADNADVEARIDLNREDLCVSACLATDDCLQATWIHGADITDKGMEHLQPFEYREGCSHYQKILAYNASPLVKGVIGTGYLKKRGKGGDCLHMSFVKAATTNGLGGKAFDLWVGSNLASGIKQVKIPKGSVCPAVVSKQNWLGASKENFTFSVTVFDSTVTVTRTDSDEPWNMNLGFVCYSGKPKFQDLGFERSCGSNKGWVTYYQEPRQELGMWTEWNALNSGKLKTGVCRANSITGEHIEPAGGPSVFCSSGNFGVDAVYRLAATETGCAFDQKRNLRPHELAKAVLGSPEGKNLDMELQFKLNSIYAKEGGFTPEKKAELDKECRHFCDQKVACVAYAISDEKSWKDEKYECILYDVCSHQSKSAYSGLILNLKNQGVCECLSAPPDPFFVEEVSAITEAFPRPSKHFPPEPICAFSYSTEVENKMIKPGLGKAVGTLEGSSSVRDGFLQITKSGVSSGMITSTIKKSIVEHSLEAWVKTDELPNSGTAAIVSLISGSTFDSISIRDKKWILASDGNRRTKSIDIGCSINDWTHVAVVVSVRRGFARVRFYIDGLPKGKAYIQGAMPKFLSNTTQFAVGRVSGTATGAIDVKVKCAALYDSALSAETIKLSFNAGCIYDKRNVPSSNPPPSVATCHSKTPRISGGGYGICRGDNGGSTPYWALDLKSELACKTICFMNDGCAGVAWINDDNLSFRCQISFHDRNECMNWQGKESQSWCGTIEGALFQHKCRLGYANGAKEFFRIGLGECVGGSDDVSPSYVQLTFQNDRGKCAAACLRDCQGYSFDNSNGNCRLYFIDKHGCDDWRQTCQQNCERTYGGKNYSEHCHEDKKIEITNSKVTSVTTSCYVREAGKKADCRCKCGGHENVPLKTSAVTTKLRRKLKDYLEEHAQCFPFSEIKVDARFMEENALSLNFQNVIRQVSATIDRSIVIEPSDLLYPIDGSEVRVSVRTFPETVCVAKEPTIVFPGGLSDPKSVSLQFLSNGNCKVTFRVIQAGDAISNHGFSLREFQPEERDWKHIPVHRCEKQGEETIGTWSEAVEACALEEGCTGLQWHPDPSPDGKMIINAASWGPIFAHVDQRVYGTDWEEMKNAATQGMDDSKAKIGWFQNCIGQIEEVATNLCDSSGISQFKGVSRLNGSKGLMTPPPIVIDEISGEANEPSLECRLPEIKASPQKSDFSILNVWNTEVYSGGLAKLKPLNFSSDKVSYKVNVSNLNDFRDGFRITFPEGGRVWMLTTNSRKPGKTESENNSWILGTSLHGCGGIPAKDNNYVEFLCDDKTCGGVLPSMGAQTTTLTSGKVQFNYTQCYYKEVGRGETVSIAPSQSKTFPLQIFIGCPSTYVSYGTALLNTVKWIDMETNSKAEQVIFSKYKLLTQNCVGGERLDLCEAIGGNKSDCTNIDLISCLNACDEMQPICKGVEWRRSEIHKGTCIIKSKKCRHEHYALKDENTPIWTKKQKWTSTSSNSLISTIPDIGMKGCQMFCDATDECIAAWHTQKECNLYRGSGHAAVDDTEGQLYNPFTANAHGTRPKAEQWAGKEVSRSLYGLGYDVKAEGASSWAAACESRTKPDHLENCGAVYCGQSQFGEPPPSFKASFLQCIQCINSWAKDQNYKDLWGEGGSIRKQCGEAKFFEHEIFAPSIRECPQESTNGPERNKCTTSMALLPFVGGTCGRWCQSFGLACHGGFRANGQTCKRNGVLSGSNNGCDHKAIGYTICECASRTGRTWDVIEGNRISFNEDAAAVPRTMYASLQKSSKWNKTVEITVESRPPHLMYLKTMGILDRKTDVPAHKETGVTSCLDVSGKKADLIAISMEESTLFDTASRKWNGPTMVQNFGVGRPFIKNIGHFGDGVHFGDGSLIYLPAKAALLLSDDVKDPYTVVIVARFGTTSTQGTRDTLLTAHAFEVKDPFDANPKWSCGLTKRGSIVASFSDEKSIVGSTDTISDFNVWSYDACLGTKSGSQPKFFHNFKEYSKNEFSIPERDPGILMIGDPSGKVVAEVAELLVFSIDSKEYLKEVNKYMRQKYGFQLK
eukprot:g2164.t1